MARQRYYFTFTWDREAQEWVHECGFLTVAEAIEECRFLRDMGTKARYVSAGYNDDPGAILAQLNTPGGAMPCRGEGGRYRLKLTIR